MAVRRDSENTDGQLFNTQKLALVDLYWSTNGPSWTGGAADNWVVNEEPPASPLCDSSWASITCAGNDVVWVAGTRSRSVRCHVACSRI
jgi:hypothetical protein